MSGTNQSAYQPTAAQDVVGVFDNNGHQLFIDARTMTADVTPKLKLMKHPMESGAKQADFCVIEPIEIKLTMTLKPETYVNTYQQIVQVFNGKTSVIVQTNVGIFASMFITSIPHKEDPAHFDTIKLTITLEKVQIVASGVSSTLASKYTTKTGGSKAGQPASVAQTDVATAKTQQSSAAYSLFYGK